MGKTLKKFEQLSLEDIDRIIEMAWEDRTPFGAIQFQFSLSESAVIALMRREMKRSSFRMWRARVSNRSTKHSQKRSSDVNRFKCSRQKNISYNKY
ncbi:MAG: TIGR03643 family protein [Aureispira sp.]|nr:TIGR03643 family protein [Aureispira sp.]